nr:PREDICTED: uncharacterized protein LOC109031445 [Bemisia tabaci]
MLMIICLLYSHFGGVSFSSQRRIAANLQIRFEGPTFNSDTDDPFSGLHVLACEVCLTSKMRSARLDDGAIEGRGTARKNLRKCERDCQWRNGETSRPCTQSVLRRGGDGKRSSRGSRGAWNMLFIFRARGSRKANVHRSTKRGLRRLLPSLESFARYEDSKEALEVAHRSVQSRDFPQDPTSRDLLRSRGIRIASDLFEVHCEDI